MKTYKALIGCERSAVIRDAFRAMGWDAWSCDLQKCEGDPRWHIVGDVLTVADNCAESGWDFFGVHPECTKLCVSGIHWNTYRPERKKETEQALEFAKKCFALCERFPMAYLENSVSILSTKVRKPEQTIQPYNFGQDASKKTCLWLRNLPPLQITKRIPGRKVEWPKGSGKIVERWANQTDSGQNKLGPGKTRSMDRARSYPGIAQAMASQWTEYADSVLF